MKALLITTYLALVGCTSVTTMDGRDLTSVPSSSCDVTVYQTYQQAIAGGPIEELCVINGTSSWSFVHTSATAIAKHKDKACACGANRVYVQSRHDTGGWDLATVTMVAFRYR